MNIVLDGPKAIGKSTFTKLFNNFKYIHLDKNTPNDLEYHFDLLKGDNQIIDRFAFSELVYSQAVPREPKLSKTEVLSYLYDKNTVFVIFATEDYKELQKRLIRRDAINDQEKLDLLKRSSDLFFELSGEIKKMNLPNVFFANENNWQEAYYNTLIYLKEHEGWK